MTFQRQMLSMVIVFVALAVVVSPRFAGNLRVRMICFGTATLIIGVNIGIEWANWAAIKLFEPVPKKKDVK